MDCERDVKVVLPWVGGNGVVVVLYPTPSRGVETGEGVEERLLAADTTEVVVITLVEESSVECRGRSRWYM
jgi:hypothetical protein